MSAVDGVALRFDFERDVVQVRKSLAQLKGKGDGVEKFVLKDPKSKTSRRAIVVGVAVAVRVGVEVGVLVFVRVAVPVGVTVAVRVIVGLRVGVSVGVLLGVGVTVRVGVGVRVGVPVGVDVGVAKSKDSSPIHVPQRSKGAAAYSPIAQNVPATGSIAIPL